MVYIQLGDPYKICQPAKWIIYLENQIFALLYFMLKLVKYVTYVCTHVYAY